MVPYRPDRGGDRELEVIVVLPVGWLGIDEDAICPDCATPEEILEFMQDLDRIEEALRDDDDGPLAA